jgi:small-conductance mechanosensitive channel
MPEISPVVLDLIWKVVGTALVGVGAFVLSKAVDRLLKSTFTDAEHTHTLRMLVRNGILILAAVVVMSVWLGVGSSFTVAMGILGAGIAFASQEVIGSLAGYVNIVVGRMYHIGDRVRIADVTGDVLDISVMRTTVMEIGEWVHADQFTGRVVTVANRLIFSGPVYNYTQHWGFLFDELTLPVPYTADWRTAAEVMLTHGTEYTEALEQRAHHDLQLMRRRYPALGETSLVPELYVVMTDNWVELTLRYIVEPRQRRAVKAELHRKLLERFQAQGITIASATMEVVGFPTVRFTGAPSAKD